MGKGKRASLTNFIVWYCGKNTLTNILKEKGAYFILYFQATDHPYGRTGQEPKQKLEGRNHGRTLPALLTYSWLHAWPALLYSWGQPAQKMVLPTVAKPFYIN